MQISPESCVPSTEFWALSLPFVGRMRESRDRARSRGRKPTTESPKIFLLNIYGAQHAHSLIFINEQANLSRSLERRMWILFLIFFFLHTYIYPGYPAQPMTAGTLECAAHH